MIDAGPLVRRSVPKGAFQMLPPRLREKLRDSFSQCDVERMCVLCQMPLQAYRDDAPCLHWLLLSGRRGFSAADLRRVFDQFDVGMAIDYLHTVVMMDRSGRGSFERRGAVYAIRWRRRQWVFTREAGAHSRRFLLSISGRGEYRTELRIAAHSTDFDEAPPGDAPGQGC